MIDTQQSLDLAALTRAYREGQFTPRELIALVQSRIASQPDHHTWIQLLDDAQLEPYLAALEQQRPDSLPLYGIPFAIKDNIDLAGIPTTAACPDYAYTPDEHAFVVARLIAAGAIPIGKTNLDQFATGLVGTRSPYGAARNSFDPDYIAGGSSSGSALAVAMGLVSFALGTDTAGSGRVPAAFNNLVGIKPSRGLLSTHGVVPACRSLDCVSIFALDCADARRVFEVAAVYDAEDAYARPQPVAIPAFSATAFHFGVPRTDQLQFFGNSEYAQLFAQSIQRLEALGGTRVEIDFEPFLEAARLLYEGPWVTERYVAIEEFIREQPDSLHPVTRAIIAPGAEASAADAFKAQYRLAECRRLAEALWPHLDCIVTPTAGTHYRLDEVEADPIRLNANLGQYTNFMNLLDLAAVAVPAGMTAAGLPFGITLFAPAFADASLLALAERFHHGQSLSLGATQHSLPASAREEYAPAGTLALAVCGAHLSGLALNHQLIDRGAFLLESTRTAPFYHLYALAGGPPQRPGLVRAATGANIELEVWAVPLAQVGSFLAGIPVPLGLGKVELEDGRWVTGFICEGQGVEGATDITESGGWRAWLKESA
jgi:allophanate hydrolase